MLSTADATSPLPAADATVALYKVLDKASQEISDAIVADVDAGKLFLK